ncbi:hypothetical protein A6770_09075 [Nostoc minutum NIES-26]|uniref:Uncharacterized protein n=1 Tax=Nostoc minutum NIES-26 TaxID=1844469 RepID=A0A367RZF1_9NOSO|nr:hypothetical protein A6770_09075 [Nostoc minutum NIES-26]
MSFRQEKKKLLHTQLVKYGIHYRKAARAAEILASEKPDELLTDEEIQLTQEVCREWLKQRKRLDSIEENISF